ncbi:hypothetical protein ACGFJ7_46225 [Actinoplanes sp. NPDC048988]|uniref:hypothetical protein n=1 Tax=Actinoplanes sp. NPDC048988 TaxID=3363901 RepID=UPI003711BE2D
MTTDPGSHLREPKRGLIILAGALAVAVVTALVVIGTRPEPPQTTGVAGGQSPATGPVTAPSTVPSTPPSTAPSSLPPSPSKSVPPSSAAASSKAAPAPTSAKPAAPPAARSSAFPNAGNTGVRPGVKLKARGDITVTKNGTVLNALDVTGVITVQASNVVISNTRVTNSAKADWGIVQTAGASNLVVMDSEIRGNGTDSMHQGIYNIGGHITVKRTEISRIADGVATNRGLIEDCYLHSPQVFDGDHVDMIQSTEGPPSGASLTIRHNTIINDELQTSAIALFQDFGVARNALIVDNYLAGGAYTVYGGEGDHGQSSNIRIENNTFGKDVFPKAGQYGPIAHFDAGGPGNTFTGNVFADTKTPVSLS